MSGPKNIDRSLKRMARKHAREALRSVQSLVNNPRVKASCFIEDHVLKCRANVEHLITMLKEQCRHCGKKIPFGCTQCVGCADERGP